ncbi:MAG TPA: diacylglycerol kinase family protein [Polyangia bacterium]|jgi:hypothetical protein
MSKEPESLTESLILVCNPRAGGRWRQLAGILDSAEAQHVRRIVTDSIDDIGPALANLGRRTKLVIIYGGDGTIQQILTDVYRTVGHDDHTAPPIALVGGGTMNLTARWCGWKESPEENFRTIAHDVRTDKLATREVPLLRIQQGDRVEYGFLFAVGSPIRILNEYEHGKKGKLAAVQFFARAIATVWSKQPLIESNMEPMAAQIIVDGEPLPYTNWVMAAVAITGSLQIGMHPFVGERVSETFYMLSYAVDPREVAVLLPFLARGMLPIDPKSLLQPVSSVTHIGLSYFGKGSLPLPLDPRYINHPARTFEIRCQEKVFTIDGEIFESTGEPIKITVGPTLRLAIKA